MVELWKDIKGYNGLYQISNLGRVKSFKRYQTGKIMKFGLRSDGYLFVNLYLNEIVKSNPVHRLVAKAFIPNPDNKPVINHIDAIKIHNFESNLEWCTQKENVQHAIRIGVMDYKGEGNPVSKLTNKEVLEIKYFIRLGFTQVNIAKIFNVSRALIGLIKNKKRWAHIGELESSLDEQW